MGWRIQSNDQKRKVARLEVVDLSRKTGQRRLLGLQLGKGLRFQRRRETGSGRGEMRSMRASTTEKDVMLNLIVQETEESSSSSVFWRYREVYKLDVRPFSAATSSPTIKSSSSSTSTRQPTAVNDSAEEGMAASQQSAEIEAGFELTACSVP
ncbi:hypothetical protein KSP40_PGU019380 [Platanthera guangdongensis]|uniref:Uncharacterized protein n=1 Tax=Platanthera guangdongensis TaxID=2320717 RepID=A0ABR2N2Q9_9ASPA